MGFLFSKPQDTVVQAPSFDDPANQKALIKQKNIDQAKTDKDRAVLAKCDAQLNALIDDEYNIGVRVQRPDGSCPPPGKKAEQGLCNPWTTEEERKNIEKNLLNTASLGNYIKCTVANSSATSHYAPEPWEEKGVMSGSVRYKNLEN